MSKKKPVPVALIVQKEWALSDMDIDLERAEFTQDADVTCFYYGDEPFKVEFCDLWDDENSHVGYFWQEYSWVDDFSYWESTDFGSVRSAKKIRKIARSFFNRHERALIKKMSDV